MRSAKVHRKSIQKSCPSLARRIFGPSVLVGLGLVLASVAFAAPETDPESVPDPEETTAILSDPDESKWRPDVGLGFLLHVQGLDGSASSNFMATDADSVSDKAISPGFRLSVGMTSPVLAQAGGFKPRLFFQTGVQYLLEDNFTSYRGTVTGSTGIYDPTNDRNCDAPAFGENVKGVQGVGPAPTNGTATSGAFYTDFAEGPAGAYYQDIEQLLPDLFSPDPNNPALSHGYDQQYIEQSPNSSANPTQRRSLQLGFVKGSGGFGVGGNDCDSNFRAKTSIEVMWQLGVGVEFTLPVLSRQFHLRVSADYRGQSFGETEGTWDRASNFNVCFAPPLAGAVGGNNSSSGCRAGPSPSYDIPAGTSGSPPNIINGYLVTPNRKKYSAPRVFARGTGSGFVTHAIGPTVQVDVDVFKRGDLRINLFLELGFAWLINDAGSSLTLDDVPDQIYNCTLDTSSPLCAYKLAGERPSVSFAVAPQTLISQGGGGVRILWSPPW
jgi:hypothetical protein